MSKVTSDHVESMESGWYSSHDLGQQSPKPDLRNYVSDPVLEKHVVRKIDMLIIPFICITYLITFIDKAMLGYSAVFGLKESLHLHGTEYSWLGLLLTVDHFSFLQFEYPTTFAMQKLPVSKWLSINLFFWGEITMALAGCNRFDEFLGLRFLLGALESCSTPAYLLITATWYTVEEQPIRIGWWSTFLGLANSFGGLLAFALGHIKGSLDSWQYQFIFIGAISGAWAIIMYFKLAERPETATWLNETEKKTAIGRLGPKHHGANHREIKKYQIIEALRDPKSWLFFLCGVATQVVNGAVSNFGSLIIEGFGYSNFTTTLFQIPYGMVILVSNVSAMYIQRWLPGQRRCFVAVFYVCPALAGAIGIHTISRDHKVALLVCYWLTSTYTASFAMTMSLITANTGGSTKRSVVNGIFFISYCVGNIVGPFSFKTSEAPTYTSGIVAMLVAYCVEALLLLSFAVYAAMLNKKKDEIVQREGLSLGDAVTQFQESSSTDRTDKEDLFFRYSY
ncbi:MFS general substrate transporter [Penicillium macrosclerotiorum]|uniref:MFS general substrate transporter n=1 Tax=Penicillium macrosclerotiorum TaxID=303699 RepID=UPI0025473807|nr:MFS general substrate transporter [Penicillium macrosclerotiorum]KAJ5664681.1 MFS general substrate transporter [Penicillium macrosclerotiorum]